MPKPIDHPGSGTKVLPDPFPATRKPPLIVEPDPLEKDMAAMPAIRKPDEWVYPDQDKILPHLSGRNIVDFLDLPIDPKTNFLGNRFLTIGSGMFLIAPSGHGKSSFSIQLLISFAIGRAAFGIKPPRPLRILLIQSEDDDAAPDASLSF